MQFLCRTRQWTSIIRNDRLWKAAAAKHQLQYSKYWPAWETDKGTHKTIYMWKLNKNSKIIPLAGNKSNQEMGYFNVGPDKEADIAASAKLTQELYS